VFSSSAINLAAVSILDRSVAHLFGRFYSFTSGCNEKLSLSPDILEDLAPVHKDIETGYQVVGILSEIIGAKRKKSRRGMSKATR
jgi:hypothetical protein